MSRATSPAALRARWFDGSMPAAGDVLAWLAGGERPDAIGEVNGRADLRGAPLSSVTASGSHRAASSTFEVLSGMVNLSGVHVEQVDFSHADLSHFRWFESTIRDCVLDGANCTDWRLWASTVSDSLMTRSSFRGAAMGNSHGGRSSRWVSCVFDRTDLRGALFSHTSVVESSFLNAKLRGAFFERVAMSRVTFVGPMVRVTWDGRRLTDDPREGHLEHVDFSEVTFTDTEMYGNRMTDCVLPPGVVEIPAGPAFLREARRAIEGEDTVASELLRSFFDQSLPMPGSESSSLVHNRNDYLVYGGEELADRMDELIALLRPPSDES